MEKRVSRSHASLPPGAHTVPEPETTTPQTRMAKNSAPQRAESAAPPESVESIWGDVLEGMGDMADEEALQNMLEGSVTDILTGAYTPAGTSDDLSSGLMRGGQEMGGPSGGDVYGAGENKPALPTQEAEFPPDETHAVGIDKPIFVDKKNTGIAARIAGENTAALLKGLWAHPKS